jgi:hypothetical protein
LNSVAVAVVYLGFVFGLVGIVSVAKPLRFLGVRTRRAGAGILLVGFLIAAAGAALPAPLLVLPGERSLLDDFVPACQFREVHAIRIHAPAEAVFRAVQSVTAGEIRFFRLLTWLRSPRLTSAREDILAAPADRPLLDVALRSGFLMLAEDPPRELVFGTLLCGRLARVTRPAPRDFTDFDRPGFCKAAMNFHLRDEGDGWIRLTTETRVFALGASARRRFAAYWRVISPGSAFIRRMWLHAVKRRAEDPRMACADGLEVFTRPVDRALFDSFRSSGAHEPTRRGHSLPPGPAPFVPPSEARRDFPAGQKRRDEDRTRRRWVDLEGPREEVVQGNLRKRGDPQQAAESVGLHVPPRDPSNGLQGAEDRFDIQRVCQSRRHGLIRRAPVEDVGDLY